MSAAPQIKIFKDHNALVKAALRSWRTAARDSIRKRGRFTVALSGGKTPAFVYRQLAAGCPVSLWAKTHIFWTDERFVALTSKDSNYRMVRENLLRHIAIPEENVHSVPVRERSVALAAGRYNGQLKGFFRLGAGQFPRFDLIILGMGEDGHTASLFPGTTALKEHRKIAVAVSGKKISRERISLTFPVLNRARNVLFLVTGCAKAGVVRELLQKPKGLPAGRVRPLSGKLSYFLDRDAAPR